LNKILLSLAGLHPRAEETVQGTQDWERGRIDDRQLAKIFERDIQQLLRLQRELSFDYVSDGQMTMAWQDAFTPFTSYFDGIKRGPLVRWFNTNTFFYAPVVIGDIHAPGDAIRRSLTPYLFGDSLSTKVVVPDPLTFAELAENEHYGTKEKLMYAYADALREELVDLGRHRVSYVQFSAPSLVARFRGRRLTPKELETVGEAVRSSLRKSGLNSGYFPYFGDLSPYFPELFDLPVDDIGIDFTETDVRRIPSSKKGLVAGVVNGRSAYLEPVELIVRRLKDIPHLDRYQRINLTPSCDLRYVPRSVADSKLVRLKEVRDILFGKGA
jgi:5-methyltetrahydropteroyltriglutamate--homocysteine methyltransferase